MLSMSTILVPESTGIVHAKVYACLPINEKLRIMRS